MKKRLISIILILVLILSISVLARKIIYDDFSNPVLDPNKWVEKSESGAVPTMEYYGVYGQKYLTAQQTPADRSIVLEMAHDIQVGDILTYDVYHVNATGNHESRLYFNGNPLDEIIGTSCGCITTGNIGYWNGNSEVGNEFGKYKIGLFFRAENFTEIYIQNPNGTVWNYNLTSTLTYPLTYAVGTRTGHNGATKILYDNFVGYR